MAQISLHATIYFPVYVPLSRLYKIAWSPQHKSYYFEPEMDRGIKIVRKHVLILRGIPQVFQRTEETEAAQNTTFLQE